jgi:tRNA-modifying protein YgfZ
MTFIVHLAHRSLVCVSGPDCLSFINGLCTTDTEKLDLKSLAYGAFLRPQGKVIGDVFFILREPQTLWLDVALSVRDELLTKLKLYKLRAKVEITSEDTPIYAAFGGPMPLGFMPDPRASFIHADIGYTYGPQIANADGDAWTRYRLGLGLADLGAEIGSDRLYAIDANLDLLGGVDFKKGCFVGQELTSRMKRRGQVKNRLLRLTHAPDSLTLGDDILYNDMKIGEIIASFEGQSLGLMRLDRLTRAIIEGEPLMANNQSLCLKINDWIRPNLQVESLEMAARG